MEGIENVITVFKEKSFRPSVYAVFIKTREQRFLTIVVAFTIDEAQRKARDLFISIPGNEKEENNSGDWDMVVVSVPGDQILMEMTELKVKPSKKTAKNTLMKKIIEGKDKALLEKSRSKFSEVELKFLWDAIKRK